MNSAVSSATQHGTQFKVDGLARLLNVTRFLEKQGLFTDERTDWLARRLFDTARSAYREGERAKSIEAFELACRLQPQIVKEIPWLARVLFSILGLRAESSLSLVRPVVQSTQRLFSRNSYEQFASAPKSL